MVSFRSRSGSVKLLMSGRRLSGRVLNVASQPVVGAIVSVINKKTRATVGATTNGLGDFVVEIANSQGDLLDVSIETDKPAWGSISGELLVMPDGRIVDANVYAVATVLDGDVEIPADMPPGARLFLLVGAYAMAKEADRPGLYRAITALDTETLRGGSGLQPIDGTHPKPPGSVPEGTYRHTRPNGNAPKLGSDRISWTTNPREAAGLAKLKGTTVVELDPGKARTLRVEVRTPAQLDADLVKYRQSLEAELAKGPGANKAARLRVSIEKTREAQQYIQRYGEHHTVGNVPQGAVRRNAAARMVGMRIGARVLLGISIFLSVKRVIEAEPDRRGEVLTFEIFDHLLFGLPTLLPAVEQYIAEETTVLSQLFPHPYMVVLDLMIGKTLVEQDPEGARYIKNAMKTPDGQYNLMRRLFGGF